MEQHPVPQQISSYQFRLVGDMTLKQFFQLAGGLLISLLFYASNLPGIIKWPFVLIFGAAGAALAFIPFQDRPLEQWIIAFFRAIYTPTSFTWKKTPHPEQYFKVETATPPAGAQPFSATDENIIDKAQTPINQKAPFLASLEGAEKAFLSKVGQLFGTGSHIPTPQPPPDDSMPTGESAPTQAPATITEQYTPQEQQEPQEQQGQSPPQRGPVEIPQQQPLERVEKATFTPKVVEENPITGRSILTFPGEPQTSPVGPALASGQLTAAQQAQFIQQAAPSPSTIPNTIVGQVIGPNGQIVEGAILEIKDAMDRPVRALKSNKLGHFLIVTPLLPGKYNIIIEKDGFNFDPVGFEANDTIIPPIQIKAKPNPNQKVSENVQNMPRFVSTELP